MDKLGTSSELEISDLQTAYLGTGFLSQYANGRNRDAITARLVHQFMNLNRHAFRKLNIDPQLHYTGAELKLKLSSHSTIGAVPLVSPVTYKPEFSLICKPRFGWNGIGPILSSTGWRILPDILNFPELKISERRIPPWVLSTVVLHRIEDLLHKMTRSFEMTSKFHRIPKGSVDWDDYARNRISRGKFLDLYCHHPELQEDTELKGMIHFALRKQKESLESQREMGVHVLKLLSYCEELINRVSHAPARRPSQLQIEQHGRSTISSSTISQGLQAIEWTAKEKGLAGLGDLHGLPWVMSMEELFESYVEAIIDQLTKQMGGRLQSGRNRETIVPLQWDPPFIGSQRYLLPDIVVDREDEKCIIDAKYKDHWEDLNLSRWQNLQEEIRNRHRNDLLQILAYASTSEKKKISCVLMYPCKRKTWDSLIERNRHYHIAELTHADRRIRLCLSAMPFRMNREELDYLKPLLRSN